MTITKHEVITVTPRDATKFLANNYEGNRNIKRYVVNEYARVMREGKFRSDNGETLMFGERDGKLYNGQHRLSAQVETGMTFEYLAVWSDTPVEDFLTLDCGSRRSAGDYIPDISNKNVVAAAAKVMFAAKYGSTPIASVLQGKVAPKAHPSNAEIVGYIRANMVECEEAARDAMRVYMKSVCTFTPSQYCAFIMLMRYLGLGDSLVDFTEQMSMDAPDDKTVTALKMSLFKLCSGNKKPDMKTRFIRLVDGYMHYREKDGVKVFKNPERREGQLNAYLQLARERTAVA